MEAYNSFFEVGVVLFEFHLITLCDLLIVSVALFVFKLVFFCVILLELDHEIVDLGLKHKCDQNQIIAQLGKESSAAFALEHF